jgi:3-hydroxybutyryl-CoA dehydrogenase
MATAQHIFILGESPLVEEYSVLCLNKKQSVTMQLNTGGTAKLPKGAKKAATPPKSVTLALELTNTSAEAKKKNLTLLDRLLGPGIPILSSSVTITVAEQSTWIKHPQRLIGIGALPSLLEGSLIEFAPARTTNENIITMARNFAKMLSKESAIVRDSIGLVMPRILCMLANEAYFAMMEGVADGNDIDTAMKLGTNYPSGPVEFARKIGVRHVHAVLSALYSHFGEDRYRIAPLLHQAAFEGT